VSAPIVPSLVDLRDLRTDNALALLDQAGTLTLPPLAESPTNYLQSLINGLCELSLKDPLTGLGNRRHFLSALEREIDRVARSGEQALLLMLDIDHFKKVNDTYGHAAGDQILKSVANCLLECVRPMDTVARYGGEEFVIILPNCHNAFGLVVSERIRESVAATVTPISPSVDVRVTVSVGGAYAPQWVRSTTSIWTERADQQLYAAKTQGRNRVCMAVQPDSIVTAEEKNLLFGHLSVSDPAWIQLPPSDALSNSTEIVVDPTTFRGPRRKRREAPTPDPKVNP
jgi:diguanylate cyclase (GGDEF)-like protein